MNELNGLNSHTKETVMTIYNTAIESLAGTEAMIKSMDNGQKKFRKKATNISPKKKKRK
jgi:hypothetical protein